MDSNSGSRTKRDRGHHVTGINTGVADGAILAGSSAVPMPYPKAAACVQTAGDGDHYAAGGPARGTMATVGESGICPTESK